jgi:hypothetical protein
VSYLSGLKRYVSRRCSSLKGSAPNTAVKKLGLTIHLSADSEKRRERIIYIQTPAPVFKIFLDVIANLQRNVAPSTIVLGCCAKSYSRGEDKI